MHLTILVVCQRILLKAGHYEFVSNNDITTLRLYHQLQDVQQFTRITTTIAQQCIGLFQIYMALL